MNDLYKKCEVCGDFYGPGTRKPNQFIKSKFCSLKCSGLAQRKTIDDLHSKITVNPETNCHIWTGYKIGHGYGMCRINRQQKLVHRVMWESVNGPVPPELQIDHLCGVKACCNVEHLRIVTARENSLADTSNNMAARYFRRLVCHKCGGDFSKFKNGMRYCRPCRHKRMMEYQRERRAKQRQAKL